MGVIGLICSIGFVKQQIIIDFFPPPSHCKAKRTKKGLCVRGAKLHLCTQKPNNYY